MSKTRPISGFPEWLPEEKLVEEELISKIREVYEAYGFTPIETPAVELLSTLLSESTATKEIYQVVRHAKDEPKEEGDLALHFDLTVPLARYVAQHYGALTFPFKRYQLQKVWRGERPQKGRFREFYQFDIDIIARDELPVACDAEVLTVLDKAFEVMAIGRHSLKLNNRKILMGFYEHLGLEEAKRSACIIAVDKFDKVGRDGVLKELLLHQVVGKVAERVLEIASLKLKPKEFEKGVAELKVDSKLFTSGVGEVRELLSLLPPQALERIEVDLGLARGLGYYTGTICEVRLNDFPEFGSAAGGGRYEDLASQFINQKLPGVGVSIGLTRLMDLILKNKLLAVGGKSPAKVLVTVYSEGERPKSNQLAETIRSYGVPTEVFFRAPKLGKQLDYAASKGIPFVVFINSETGVVEAKELATKEQVMVKDLAQWAKELKRS